MTRKDRVRTRLQVKTTYSLRKLGSGAKRGTKVGPPRGLDAELRNYSFEMGQEARKAALAYGQEHMT